MTAFKRDVTTRLWSGPVTIKFTKVDGTEREIRCTLDPLLMPPVLTKVTEGVAPNTELKVVKEGRKPNPDVRTIYDMDAKAWKSFRWDSVISVTYEV